MSFEVVRLVKYVFVGVLVTGIDFVSFWVIFNILEKLGFKKFYKLRIATVCNILAFLVANSSSFIINSWFTFSDASSNRGWVPFLLVSIFSLSISSSIVQLMTSESMHSRLNSRFFNNRLSAKQLAILVKLLAAIVTMFTNYVGYKYLVFTN